MKILVVDDERTLVKGIKFNLENEGYEVECAYDGAAAVELAREGKLDLIILDLMMPEVDGLEACMRIREFSNVPVIMLTAKSEDADKLMGFECGADDYLTKPFGTAELLARVRTAIRHTRTASGNDEIAQKGTYSVGELVIDYNKHQVLVRGENVKLTLSEFRIVALLGKHAGKVLTYDAIIKELWGPRAGSGNQILRVNMANIRRKLKENPSDPKYIHTELGIGYRMLDD